MAEGVITLGIGSAPGSVAPFILLGLSPSQIAGVSPTAIALSGRYAVAMGLSGRFASSLALSGRYAPDIDLEGGV